MKKLLTLLSVVLGLSIVLNAQNTFSLNIDSTNARLSDVLDSFTAQTGITFSFERSLGDVVLPKVHVSLSNAPLERLLSEVLAGSGIEWKVSGMTVALSGSKVTPPICAKTMGGYSCRF